jgi:protein-tyrosine-phosphatase
MAEAFARREFAQRGIAANVSSCGLLSDGRPAAGEVIDLLADRGLDVTDHRSRTMTPELIDRSTLIIGMERMHVIEIVTRDETAFDKTFTLPELVRRLEGLSLDEDGTTPAPTDVLAAVAEGRTHRDLLRIIGDDEIPDPIGKSGRFFDRTADEIDALVIRMVDVLWPDTQPSLVSAPSGND